MPAPKGNKYGYQNHNAGRPAKWTVDIIEKEAELFAEWADKPDSMILRKFAADRGYGHKYLYEWREKSEAFRDAYEYAQTIIGCRREMECFEKMTLRYAPMYDDELESFERAREKFKSDLKKQEEKEKVMNLAETAKKLAEGGLSQQPEDSLQDD